MTNEPRHFLDLIDIAPNELRGIIEDSRAMKAHAARLAGSADGGQDAGDDLRQAVDAHARVVRRRHAPARRPDHRAHRPGNAARPRRDRRRHRSRAVALRRRDHDPRPRARHAARARAICHRAGHQRPDAALASLPDHGRRDDLRGARRPDPRPQGGVDRRRQQRAHLVDARRAAVRLRARGRDAARTRAEAQGVGVGRFVGRGDRDRPRSRRRRWRGPTAS